jgi:hypothetical protein
MRSEQFLLKFSEVITKKLAIEVPKGSNRGPWIDEALKLSGAGLGNPWCAAAVYKSAMDTDLYKKSDLPYPAASVYGWAKFFEKKGYVFDDYTKVKRGDIGFYLNENNKGHIFAINEVIKVGPLWYVRTSEGNTNEDGSREGWLALKRKRLISTKKYKFIAFREY